MIIIIKSLKFSEHQAELLRALGIYIYCYAVVHGSNPSKKLFILVFLFLQYGAGGFSLFWQNDVCWVSYLLNILKNAQKTIQIQLGIDTLYSIPSRYYQYNT